MAGASTIKAGGAFVEIGGRTEALRAALGAASRSVKVFIGGVKLAARGVVASARVMAAAMRKVASAIGGAVRRLKDFALVNIRRVVMGITAVMGLAAREAIRFEAAMARVNTIFGMSSLSLDDMSKKILAMAGRVGKAPVQLANALYQVGSAGVAAGKSTAFLETAVKSATAGVTDAFTAVDVLTTLLNTYGMSADNAMSVSDDLFATVKEGKTTFDQLARSMGRVAPIAAATGVPLKEISAALATLTKGGLPTTEAITGVRAILLDIIKPADQSKKMAKKLGIAFSLAALQAKGLGGMLLEIGKATKGSTSEIAQLFTNTRSLNAVLSLAVAQSSEYEKQLKIMQDTAGATNRAFEEIARTAEFRLAKALAASRAAFVNLGKTIVPLVVGSSERAAAAFTMLAEWVGKNTDLIEFKLRGMWYYILDGWGWLKDMVKPVLDAIQGEHETLWEGIGAAAAAGWEVLKTIFAGMDAVLRPLIKGLGLALGGEWDAAFEVWATAVRAAVDGILTVFEGYLPAFVDMGLGFIYSIIEGLRQAEALQRIGGLILDIYDMLTESKNLKKLVELGEALGEAVAQGIWNAVKIGIKELGAQLPDWMRTREALELEEEFLPPGTQAKRIAEARRRDPTSAPSRAVPTAAGGGGGDDVDLYGEPLEEAGFDTPTTKGMGGGVNITQNIYYKKGNIEVEETMRDAARLERRGRF